MPARENRGQQKLDHLILSDDDLVQLVKKLGLDEIELLDELRFTIADWLLGGGLGQAKLLTLLSSLPCSRRARSPSSPKRARKRRASSPATLIFSASPHT